MTLANPWGLLGLFSLPVVLALHLLRERRNQYVVSYLELWSFLEVEVRGSRPRRIPLSWLLLLDLLIAALLSLALARPQMSMDLPIRDARHMVILLDASTSMLARDVPPSRFAQAQVETAALLNSLGPRDVATVLTFGKQARWVADTRQDELAEILTQVSTLQAGETGNALREALALGEAALEQELPVEFHVLTDGAYPPLDLEAFDHSIRWNYLGKRVSNQAVLTIQRTSPATNRTYVFARLANFSDQPTTRIVSMLMDGNPVESASLTIPRNATIPQNWTLTGEPAQVAVALLGGDNLHEDDIATLGIQPSGLIRVALVAEDPHPIQQAVEAFQNTELQIIPPEDYTPYVPFDLVILRGFLPEEMPQGAVLVLEPPRAAGGSPKGFPQVGENQEIPQNPAIQIPSPDPLLEGVDLSSVRWVRARYLNDIPQGFITLVEAGGLPLILRGTVTSAAGSLVEIVLMTADLRSGNFAKHPSFPVIMGNLLRELRRAPLPEQLQTGEAISLPPVAKYPAINILPPNAEQITLREKRPPAWEDTRSPGVYHFELADREGRLTNYLVGVNAGSLAESDLRPGTWTAEAQAQGVIGKDEAGEGEPTQERQIDLMPWLLGLAVLALILEAILAWR